MTDENPWKTISSRIAYTNPWISVREDQVIRPDGSDGIYGVVQLPESVGILAVDSEDRVALVRQWRYVHGRVGIEIPTGGLNNDESHLDAAKRELLEETGLVAQSWTPVGLIENSNGATTDVAHMFLAEGLTEGTQPAIADEAIELIWVPFDKAVQMALDGEIRESTSVALLIKAALIRSGHVGSGASGDQDS